MIQTQHWSALLGFLNSAGQLIQEAHCCHHSQVVKKKHNIQNQRTKPIVSTLAMLTFDEKKRVPALWTGVRGWVHWAWGLLNEKKIIRLFTGWFQRRQILAGPVHFNRCALVFWHEFACFTASLKRVNSSGKEGREKKRETRCCLMHQYSNALIK